MKPSTSSKSARVNCCPCCGNQDVSSMSQLRDVVSTSSNEFSSDLADWLSPPKRPTRPVSNRHRTGLRNSVAFGLVWVMVFSAAYFALSATLPSLFTLGVVGVVGIVLGVANWRTESRLATKEDKLLLGAHWERQRAYLQRRRVWARLIYCSKCALVVDPITHQTASLYDVHELANSKVKSITYKGFERRTAPRNKQVRTKAIIDQTHGL